jgi:hypothetical protein
MQFQVQPEIKKCNFISAILKHVNMRLFYFLLCLGAFTSIKAQQYCGTDQMQAKWFASHPELKAKYEEAWLQQSAAQKNIPSQLLQGAAAAADYTIPVVFHILHLGGTENISDAQVKDAVNILSRDYKKENADTANVVAAFKNIIGRPNIHFQLASKDPQGKCTNGIIRYWDPNTEWTGSFADYTYTWPHDKYLNIYVVKEIDPSMNAAAYTYLPSSWIPAYADAIVTQSHYVGSIGTGAAGRSRVLTHEVGHWLGLQHVWGGNNNPGVACGDDGVFDTPETKGYTSCNLSNNSICNPGYPENVQNYMDYSYCSNMFTIGQGYWMVNTLNSSTQNRKNLSNFNNLAFTLGQGSSCIARLDVNTASITACAGATFAVHSYTSNIEATMLWSAPNSIITSPQSGSTAIQFTSPGQYIITCEAITSGGTAQKTIVADIVDATTDITELNSESFETGSDLPDGWKSVYTYVNYQWEKTTDASSHDVSSMVIKGENFAGGVTAILESPSYDLKNNPGAVFTFKYAYARKSSNHQDIFKVQASTDCGGTWKDIYLPGTAALAIGSGEVQEEVFTPVDFQWKLYTLSSHPTYKSLLSKASNVRFRFSFTEADNSLNGGNRFYLDEINFTPVISTVGLNELQKSLDLTVFPNPTHGPVQLQFTLSDEAEVAYSVSSVTGQIISEGQETRLMPGTHDLQINTDNKLPEGIYFLNLHLNGVHVCKKIVVH